MTHRSPSIPDAAGPDRVPPRPLPCYALALALPFALAACSGSDGSGDVDAGATCVDPLTDEDLGNLAMGLEDHAAMRPGQSRTFQLGVLECCVIFQPMTTCTTWSLDTEVPGVSMDPNGTVTVDPSVPHGVQFTVVANVEDGRRTLTMPVYVYTPEGNPLLGTWSESARLDETGETTPPENPIGELRFLADGTFHVTWSPFEVYIDYWGDYTYDLESGALEMTPTGGNYTPDDVDGVGTFQIDGGATLDLIDIWLGQAQGANTTPSSGHRFSR